MMLGTADGREAANRRGGDEGATGCSEGAVAGSSCRGRSSSSGACPECVARARPRPRHAANPVAGA